MYKFFVVSDVHSFYTEMRRALDEAGYDENNPKHYLISCGDLFDRGPESQQVLDYIMRIHEKGRCILVRGNHEYLFKECAEHGYYKQHDIHNGTVRSILQLGVGLGPDEHWEGTHEDFEKACEKALTKFMPYYNLTQLYFETAHYIFVHSWIPCKYNPYRSDIFNMLMGDPSLVYDRNWRHSPEWIWKDEAVWANPFKRAYLNETKKTIVFGHYHTSWYHSFIEEDGPEFGEGANFGIANYERYNVIGIDACTAYSHKCNVLVLEDEMKRGRKSFK